MRLARRRPEQPTGPAVDPDPSAPPQAAVPPAPPTGAVVVTFAGLLDGRRLWLAVVERPGRLALRLDGQVLDLPDDLTPADQQPGHLSARIDLAGFDVDARGERAEVVLVPLDRGAPVPVWSAPLDAAVVPAVMSGPGEARLGLERMPDGRLLVGRASLDDAVDLRAVTLDDDGARLALGGVPHERGAAEVRLIGEGDTPLAQWPITDGVAVLGTGPLADLPAQNARVLVVAGEARWPIRRIGNDLPEPGRTVPMPRLLDVETEEPRLRLRWNAHGLLVARIFPPGGPDSAGDAGEGDDA